MLVGRGVGIQVPEDGVQRLRTLRQLGQTQVLQLHLVDVLVDGLLRRLHGRHLFVVLPVQVVQLFLPLGILRRVRRLLLPHFLNLPLGGRQFAVGLLQVILQLLKLLLVVVRLYLELQLHSIDFQTHIFT